MSTAVGYLVGQVGALSGARFEIPEKGIIIGRDPNHADLIIDDSLISRRHARIAPTNDGRLYLIDLQSRNGTYLGGRKLTAAVALNDGDRIDLGGKGQAVFTFEAAETSSVSGMLRQAFGETVGPAEWKPGDVIGRKFQVRGVIGKGGFGVVYLVHDNEIGQLCALKTFRHEFLSDETARNAFKREALLWVNLDEHPFVLGARWVDDFSGQLFVKMDYIAPDSQHRVSLGDHLTGEPLDADQTLEWAIQFCLGMEHAIAHGIKCHRDIKPANILVSQQRTLKITDFGLASAAESALCAAKNRDNSIITCSSEAGFGFSILQTDGEMRCGTPGYLPPEVYRGERADIRCDIYSFGLVLWQMATGSRIPPFIPPYRGDMGVFLRDVYEQQMEFRLSRISHPLWPTVKRCLWPKPSKRYSDFGERRDQLEVIYRKRTGRTVILPAAEHNMAFWANKGASLSALGQYEEAIRCHDKALAIDPHHPRIWHNKGVALHGLRRYEEAISHYDRALAIDARYANAWNDKGFALALLGRHGEAVACFDKALAIDPQFAEPWSKKGVSLNKLDRHEEAVGCFDKALAIDPRYVVALGEKSNSLVVLRRLQEALVCLDNLLTIDPRNTNAWFNKAVVLASLDRSEEAVNCCDKILEVIS